MKKCVWVALALVAMLGFSVNRADARGGGGFRGGARPGGGIRPSGNFGAGQNFGGQKFGGQNFGTGSKLENSPLRNNAANGQFNKTQGMFGQQLQSTKANAVGGAQNKVSQLQANFSSKNEPFSPAWYADHPGAWQYTHPHADAWAVAGIGATAAWLGIGAGYAAADDGTYYTSDDSTTDQEPAADDATQPEQPQDAAQLAAAGAKDVPNDTQFLPLGVFALAPQGHNDATAVVQLSVTKDGILRGSYCDLISDQGQTIFGAIDKQSRRAAWTIGPGGKAVFDTTLDNLTQADGQVALEFASGDVKQYTLARFENGNPTPDQK
ncbi:MAG: hypothetical protein WD845_09140 [Pirellulales bacterium]